MLNIKMHLQTVHSEVGELSLLNPSWIIVSPEWNGTEITSRWTRKNNLHFCGPHPLFLDKITICMSQFKNYVAKISSLVVYTSVFPSSYVHIYIYIYVHIYIYIYMCIYVYIITHTYVYMHIHLSIYIYNYIYTYPPVIKHGNEKFTIYRSFSY